MLVRTLFTAALLALVAQDAVHLSAKSQTPGPDLSWGAIAYSKATGRYGWASRCPSAHEAQSRALRACAARDGALLVTTTAARLSLALGQSKEVFGCATGEEKWDVDNRAWHAAHRHTPNAYIAVSLANR